MRVPHVLAIVAVAGLLALTGCSGGESGNASKGSGDSAAVLVPAAGAATSMESRAAAAPGTPVLADTVTANGLGKALASPDLAEMTFGVATRDSNAETAMSEAAKAGKRIADALKRQGIAEKDLQTASVSLYPRTDSNGRITDYEASLSVRATVRDMAKLGTVITAGSEGGANQIYGPTFSMDDANPAKSKAIEAAVGDAKARAEVMAKAAGRKLGRIVAVSESGSSFPVYGAERAFAADAAQAVPIQPGEIETSTSMTVVFELL